MFQITNPRDYGELTFHTARGRPVVLHPGKTRVFEVEDLNVGLLRVMLGKGSYYKVRADNEEAESLVKLALEPKRKLRGSPVVHGSTEPKAPDFVSVRDMKNQEKKRNDEEGERIFIREEQTSSTPKQSEPPPAPEKSALELLIEAAPDLPFGDFRTNAKAELGDAFPNGQPGRIALIEALKAKLADVRSALAQSE